MPVQVDLEQCDAEEIPVLLFCCRVWMVNQVSAILPDGEAVFVAVSMSIAVEIAVDLRLVRVVGVLCFVFLRRNLAVDVLHWQRWYVEPAGHFATNVADLLRVSKKKTFFDNFFCVNSCIVLTIVVILPRLNN